MEETQPFQIAEVRKPIKKRRHRPHREPFRFRPNQLPIGWEDAVLDQLRMVPVLSRATRMAGVSRRTCTLQMELDEDFRVAVEDALEEGRERNLESLHEAAEAGNTKIGMYLASMYIKLQETSPKKPDPVRLEWSE